MSMSIRASVVAMRMLRARGLSTDRARSALKGENPAQIILNPARYADEYMIVSDDAFWGNLLAPIMG